MKLRTVQVTIGTYKVCLEKGSDQLIEDRRDRNIVYIVSQSADPDPFLGTRCITNDHFNCMDKEYSIHFFLLIL